MSKHFDSEGAAGYPQGVGSLVDYDVHYRKGRGQCGDPFPEFVAFFERGCESPGRVLDLGCGQGRDALLAARHGHEVVGVDLSAIGIAQMLEDAKAQRLRVTGVVSDVVRFKSRRKFDVVVLDRVLHLLLDDAERQTCLMNAARLTRKGGDILIADTPRHQAQIRRFFEDRPRHWSVTKRRKGFLFAHKGPSR